MNYLFKIYDVYNIRVRMSVGIITIAPIILSLYLLIPEVQNISFTAVIIITSLGMCNLMISLSRYFSRKASSKCFSSLLPAQQMLLPDDTTLDAITKKRYHEFFLSKVKGLSFTDTPSNVKNSCNSAIAWLIAQTRNAEKFPLIKEESINFGFAKNLYGLKPIGIVISSSLFLVESGILVIKVRYSLDILTFPNLVAAIVMSLTFLLLWTFAVRKDWILDSGKKYARVLLSACDSEYFKS